LFDSQYLEKEFIISFPTKFEYQSSYKYWYLNISILGCGFSIVRQTGY